MSSNVVVVLDSSEDEDEAPPTKKHMMARSIQGTITPIQRRTPPNLPAAAMKPAKARIIPSSITVKRHSPVMSCSGGPVISNTLLLPGTANIAKPQLPILPKINAAFSLNINERRTPTPPKQLLQALKRKTPTPPQSQQRTLSTPPTVSITCTPSTSMATTLHPMAASATPPLKLMATPPHTPAVLSDPLLINPQLIHANIPQSTTISMQTITVKSHNNNNNNSNNNNNNCNSNKNKINDNFKIHLPPKRMVSLTPSPRLSPVLKTTLLTPSVACKFTPASLSTSASTSKSTSPNLEKSVRRITPTTILKNSDEAWLQRQRPAMPPFDSAVRKKSPFSRSSPETVTLRSIAPRPQLHATLATSQPRTPPQRSPTPMQAEISPRRTAELEGNSRTPPSLSSPSSVKLNGDSRQESGPPPQRQPVGDSDVSKYEARGKTPATPPSVAEECAPLDPDFEELIKECRKADPSPDMEKLIKMKLIKYYYEVHPDFVKSRGFRKNLRTVIERIQSDPELVYYNLKTIVDELKVRRKCKAVVLTNEESSVSTGNKHTDEQIKKLNKALYILTKRIEKLEEAEVNWDDDDSSYLQVERFKKRACQIYEKICDLTGESKSAHRLVRKPIQFTGTAYPHYNKTLQAFVNRTKEFPDYHDVLRMLEHCNLQYSYDLSSFEVKRIAHDAFTKVGRLLQSRRKTDLYETVTHYTANAKDPATTDPMLLAKLSENQKNNRKISEIIDKYARDQDLTSEEQKEARLQQKLKLLSESDEAQKDVAKDTVNEKEPAATADDDDDDDDDDGDEEDEEEEPDLEEEVNTLANGALSEAESEEGDSTKPTDQSTTSTVSETDKQQAEAVADSVTDSKKHGSVAATPSTDKVENQKTTPNTCDTTPVVAKRIEDNLKKTINNNIERAKTVALDHDPAPAPAPSTNRVTTTIPEPQRIPNGNADKLKDTSTMQNSNIKAATKTVTVERTTTATAATTTTTPKTSTRETFPTLRIMSVSSLNGSIDAAKFAMNKIGKTAVAPEHSAAMSGVKPTTIRSETPTNNAQTQKHRTVAEIVISDEES